MEISITDMKDRLNNLQIVDYLTGGLGEVVMVERDGTLASKSLINEILVSDTEEGVNAAKGSGSDFKKVFDTWERISFEAVDALATPLTTLESIPAELDAWVYDETLKRIYCTLNTTSVTGFISPTRHENYVLDVYLNKSEVGAGDADDDLVGLVLGLVEEEGRYYPLIYGRTVGGHGETDETVHAIRVGLNGVVAYGSIADLTLNTTPGGGWAATPGGCRVQVAREGNIITVKTTDVFLTVAETEAAPWVESATFTLDLDANPDTKRFIGPQIYGYCSQSQPQSSFDVISSPSTAVTIYDLWGSKIWTYDEGIKEYVENDLTGILELGTFYNDSVANKLYYYTPEEVLKELL